MALAWPRRSRWARRLGRYPSSAAIFLMRSRVRGSTLPMPLRAWDTVVRDTDAAAATSAIVGRRAPCEGVMGSSSQSPLRGATSP